MLGIISAFFAGALVVAAIDSASEGHGEFATFCGIVALWNAISAVILVV
jgi:hypothetical protein